MKCTKVKRLLPEYSVGTLSQETRYTIRQHLDSCSECMQELIELERTASVLDSITQEEPPDFLWLKVRREISQQSKQTKTPLWKRIIEGFWQRRVPALATTGLAVLMLVLGLYFALWQSPTEQQELTLYAEMEQQTFSYWNTSFADRAALGMLINTQEEGENNENSEILR